MTKNKEIEYSFVLLNSDKSGLYCIRDGVDGWCTTLHKATKFATEMAARNKRDELHEKYKVLYEVKRLVTEYELYNI